MGSKNTLAFIIPAYNEELLLPATLQSLFPLLKNLLTIIPASLSSTIIQQIKLQK